MREYPGKDGYVKGRGAGQNPSGRYEKLTLHQLEYDEVGEGQLGSAESEEFPKISRHTQWRWDSTRSVINKVDSPDIGFRLSINPYRGCEHGCTYCYARPSHAWLGMSAGLDFETRLLAKKDAAALLRRELALPSYKPQPIAIGFNTDAWQPLERKLGITRSILEVLAECRNPAAVISKSVLILRDKELLARMAERQLVQVAVSVTTLDADLNARMEPRAASPVARLRVIRELSALGIPVTVMVAPIIPGLTDSELEAVLEKAAAAGASGAGYTLLRLPHELQQLFPDWLRHHYPSKADKVLASVARIHGGRLYNPRFFKRMRGEGVEAEMISQRFALARKRFGLDTRLTNHKPLDASAFRPPAAHADQQALF